MRLLQNSCPMDSSLHEMETVEFLVGRRGMVSALPESPDLRCTRLC
jgi:hypothetical protein